jgi:hypothetical protein
VGWRERKLSRRALRAITYRGRNHRSRRRLRLRDRQAFLLPTARRNSSFLHAAWLISGRRRRGCDLGSRTDRGRLRRRLARALSFLARCRHALLLGDRHRLFAGLIAYGRLLSSNRQERERIDVAVRIGSDPDSEVDVRRSTVVRRSRNGADSVPLAYESVLGNADRAQSDKRDRIAVFAADRDGAPASGHRAGERDRAGHGRTHARTGVTGDIDAAVLSAGIGIVAQRKGAEHLTVERPSPARRRSGQDHRRQCSREREHKRASHLEPPICCQFCKRRQRSWMLERCQFWLQ